MSPSASERVGDVGEQPLDLAQSPKIGLLDLPREIRDIIYQHCLKALRRIVISSNVNRCKSVAFSLKARDLHYWPPHCYHDLAWNLIWCKNRTIAFEAAQALYRFNTFSFSFDWDWDIPLCFLRMIGESNRQQLRSLFVYSELQHIVPEAVQQAEDTNATFSTAKRFRIVNRIDVDDTARLMKTTEMAEMPVYSAPIIEDCFRALGNNAGPPLTLTVNFSVCNQIPGVGDPGNSASTAWDIWVRAFPDAAEQFKEKYTAKFGRMSRVSLRWQGRFVDGDPTGSDFEGTGWEILEWIPYGCNSNQIMVRRGTVQ